MKKLIIVPFLLLVFCLSGVKLSFSQTDDWEEVSYNTGDKPNCISSTEKFDYKMENFLKILIGRNTNVIVKVHNTVTDECIRCVFINAGETFEIKNIPEGIYYLKIAFGNFWMQKNSAGQKCDGKFQQEVYYKKGDKLLDFNTVKTEKGIKIPNFELKLEIFKKNKKNEYKSSQITEEEFFK
jgi:hypothetical protein